MERFDYTWCKSRDSAERLIEDYFASGEIDSSDYPRIERRKTGRGLYYAITLLGYERRNVRF